MIDQNVFFETLRYLGMGNTIPDETLKADILSAIDCVTASSSPKHVYRRGRCQVKNGEVWLDTHVLKSEQLAMHLSGCREAFLFASTLGVGVDRLLQRDAVLKPSLAVMEQAAAAAVIESYSGAVCRELEAEIMKEGVYHLRPRFSAGYGDLSLEEQVFFLQALEAAKRIGLMYTDGFMLIPTKSITAVIGIGEGVARCFAKGCATCSKMDCTFRKV